MKNPKNMLEYGHFIHNNELRRSIVITPGVASLSIREAAVQLLGKPVPTMLEDDANHSGLNVELADALIPITSYQKKPGYEIMRLVRHPVDRALGAFKHVIRPEKRGTFKNENFEYVFKSMFTVGHNGAMKARAHFKPQITFAPDKSIPFVKLEDGGYQQVCDFMGVLPVPNRKDGREQIRWRGKLDEELKTMLTMAYACDLKTFGYSIDE